MAECSVHPGNLLPGCHWCRTGTEPGAVVPGKVFFAKTGADTGSGGEGWTYIGETAGPLDLQFPEIPVPDLELFRSWPPPPITITVSVDTSEWSAALRLLLRQVTRLTRANKRLARANKRFAHVAQDHPDSYSHCRACHPEQAPRPLAVDGHEYHRRQLARVRRKR